jgi:tyrosinase
MGGNGAKVAHQGIQLGGPAPYNVIPPGDGGGCVTTGPFKKYQIPHPPCTKTD